MLAQGQKWSRPRGHLFYKDTCRKKTFKKSYSLKLEGPGLRYLICNINVKNIAFGNKEHTTDQKMGVSVLLRLFISSNEVCNTAYALLRIHEQFISWASTKIVQIIVMGQKWLCPRGSLVLQRFL